MPARLTDEQRSLLESSRVGHLATVDEHGQPHVVPVCYAWHDGALYSPIDEKPKRDDAGPLRRQRNLAENPRACLTVDRYDEDWSRLAWVQVRGTAEILSPSEENRAAIGALRQRYPQYATMKLEARPLIRLTPLTVRSWRAS